MIEVTIGTVEIGGTGSPIPKADDGRKKYTRSGNVGQGKNVVASANSLSLHLCNGRADVAVEASL